MVQLWPSLPLSLPETLKSSTSGGDYVSARRILLTRYIIPWMRALHALDTTAYAGILFDFCRSRAAEKVNDWGGSFSPKDDVPTSLVSKLVYNRRSLTEDPDSLQRIWGTKCCALS